MLRGTTARTRSVVLAAVLLALQLFIPTASVASVNPDYVIPSADCATPGTQTCAAARTQIAVDAEEASCGKSERLNGDTPPFRVRDRQRSADSAPQTPARPLLARDPAGVHGGTSHTVAAASLRTTRSSAAHSRAVLQVFRC